MKASAIANLTCALGVTLAAGSGILAPSARAEAPVTAENWGEMVGFKVDTNLPLPAGSVVHKGNVDQIKALVPPGLEKLIRKYELKLTVKAYEPIHPSLGYIAATNANRGKTKVVDVGKDYRKPGITGWGAGLPFPKPASALEVATNFVSSYTGDDADRYYDVYWISAKSGVEHNEYWRWASLRGIGRTDIDPKPNIDALAKERLAGTAVTFAIEPYDKKGFGALFSRSIDPIDLQGHTYVPAMRRILRMSLGTRGDAWNATDYLYEDVGGYLGAVEWMNWKLVGQKTMLMPLHGGVKHAKDTKVNFEMDAWPHWNPKIKWEPRPVYVLEATPKFADYPYSKMLILVDAEAYVIPYKEAYDKKGELWKIILNCPKESADPKSKPMEMGVSLAIDLQAEHATAVAARSAKSNVGLDPQLFTVASLRKRGH
jgi:hypothetical protein